MPQKPESDTEKQETYETTTLKRAKVKKTHSFSTFSNIGVKLLTKYRKSHTLNGKTTESNEAKTKNCDTKTRHKNSILRRPSWRKLTTHIRKFAHQVTNVSILRGYGCVCI